MLGQGRWKKEDVGEHRQNRREQAATEDVLSKGGEGDALMKGAEWKRTFRTKKRQLPEGSGGGGGGEKKKKKKRGTTWVWGGSALKREGPFAKTYRLRPLREIRGSAEK